MVLSIATALQKIAEPKSMADETAANGEQCVRLPCFPALCGLIAPCAVRSKFSKRRERINVVRSDRNLLLCVVRSKFSKSRERINVVLACPCPTTSFPTQPVSSWRRLTYPFPSFRNTMAVSACVVAESQKISNLIGPLSNVALTEPRSNILNVNSPA